MAIDMEMGQATMQPQVPTVSAGVVNDRLKKSVQFKDGLQLAQKWSSYEKFRAGEQWPAPTPLTANLPRPVFNIVDYIIQHKVAQVASENLKMVYNNTEEVPDGQADWADMFTKHSEITWEDIKQDQLNMRVINSAASTGIGIWHYYMDMSESGGMQYKWVGKMQGEAIDAMNIHFGNPNSLYVKEQPWIIIVKRELVSTIRSMAQENGLPQEQLMMISGDKNTDNLYQGAQQELEDEERANLITMYFRSKQDGLIYYQKSCGSIVVQQATPTKKKLYPIIVFNWKERKESIYGTSETEGIIPNQKVINVLLAMQVMSVQLTGFPKLVYKKGAINPEKIKNILGEMIEENSNLQGFNVQYLQAGQVTPLAKELTQNFIDYTKDLCGAHETATGEGAPENATAIMLLQNASKIPLEQIKQRYYQAIEDIGRVWEEFWKQNYTEARVMNVKDEMGQEDNVLFRGAEAQETEMNLKIDIGPSSVYSETYVVQSLDKFLEMGLITFPQYLKYVPRNVVPYKDALLKELQQMQMQQQQQMIDDMVMNMSPAERQIYNSADPIKKQQILLNLANQKSQELQQGGQPQQQGQPQQSTNKSQNPQKSANTVNISLQSK